MNSVLILSLLTSLLICTIQLKLLTGFMKTQNQDSFLDSSILKVAAVFLNIYIVLPLSTKQILCFLI